MPRLPRQRRMIVEALEPRLMFSATADIAVFHDSSSDVDYLAHAAADIDLSHIYDLPDAPVIVLTDDSANDPASTSNTHALTSNTAGESPPPPSNVTTITYEVPDSPGLTTTTAPTSAVADDPDSGLVIPMAKADVQEAPLANPDTPELKAPVFVFVDTTVENYQALVKDIQDNNADQNITIVYLDPDQNGVQQITDILAEQTGVTAIHLITHGSAGSIQLGSVAVNQNTLDLYAEQLTAWQKSLTTDADILLYGCDVAATEAGQLLIGLIGELTQADTAASTNATGNVNLGGDWNLEYQYGSIETRVLISAQTQEEWNLILANTHYVYIGGGSSTQTFTATSNVGQIFNYDSSGATYTVNQIVVKLKTLTGAATQSIYVTLRNSWDGAVLRTANISSTALSDTFEWYAFDFANYNLNDNQNYYLQIYTLGTDAKVAAQYNSGNAWNNSEIVVNGSHNSSNDLTFVISYDDGSNQAPYISNAIPNQAATEKVAFSYTFPNNTFADSDLGDRLTYTATLGDGSALPSWLSFNATTRTFSGTPGANDSGTIAVKVIASDGTTTGSDTFDIVIANNNVAPTVANAIPNQAATEDSAFSFQFAADTFNDADVSDTLTYTATLSGGGALPSWLTFNAATRTFSGTPLNADVGTISVNVVANDGQGGTISDDFTITTANSNDAPTVANAIANKAATEDSAFSFTFPTNTFNDVDVGDTLTYTATLSGGGALPTWLTFNAATRTFSGTPLNADVGTITVKLTATDGSGATVDNNFNIVTANTNDAPTVANAIADKNATEDSAFSFTFPTNTFNDVDVGDTLTYTATLSGGGALPTWLTFNAATRTFSGTPLNADVGTISITLTATDGSSAAIDDTFDIVIANSNDAPTVANPIANKAATEDSAFSFTFPTNTFNDVDVGDSLTYTATLSGGGALPTWLTFNAATRTFSGTPLNADVGTITVKLTATDVSGATVDNNFNIVVANTNDAPTVANPIPDQNATEDSAFSFQFASNAFNDVDGDTLTYTATLSGGGALPSWLTFNAATRTFSGTPLNANVGTISIEVVANDSHSGIVSDTFDLVVANTNDAPTVANPIANKAATEDSAFSFTFPANTFNDVDVGDTLTYTATLSGGGALPTWLTFNAGTRTFSGTPLNADVGTISVRLTASDGNGGSVNNDFNIAVANTNDAPTVANPIADQAGTQNAAFSFQFASNVFNDVDVGDTLTYTATLSGGGALPTWLTFNAGTRTFSGTPLAPDVGTITIQVTANDGHGGTINDNFDIVIANVNDAPVVANPLLDRSVVKLDPFSYQFAANAFTDIDGDPLTYSAQLSGGGGLPAWLSFDANTRTFSGTPQPTDVGSFDVEVTASDGSFTTTDTFSITVTDVNFAPTVANPIPDQSVNEDAAFNFQFAANTFDDVDVGNVLYYSAQLSGGGALPSWLSFDSATHTFSGTPLNANVGTISVEVIASDGNENVSDTFDIVVSNTNDAPTVANPIANQAATEDSAFSFTFANNTFNDVDVGNTLTYTAQLSGGGSLPSWLSFNAVTQTFSGTPLNANVGTLSVEVIASDGTANVSDVFDIVIANTNDAPTVNTGLANQSATEDSAFSFQFSSTAFIDMDVGDTLDYSATLSGGGALPTWLSFNASTRTFSGTPLNADVGTISIEVTADDGNGGTITDSFDIVVANSNDAPTVSNIIPNQTATEDSAFSFTFADTTFNDVDVGDTLTYTATLSGGGALPTWLTFNAATRTFSGTPINADVGTLTIDITADDSNGGTVTDSFDIVITNTNDAPTVANAIADKNATEDSAFSFTFPTNTFNDVDVGNTLTYTATLSGGGALPTWLTFNAATRTFSGTPLNADVGTITIDLVANDSNGGTITDSFDIVIANSNDAPTVANAIADKNATEDSAFSFTFPTNTFNDVDVGDSLTYTATLSDGNPLPTWLVFDATTRTFSGTPLNGDVGTISIKLTATDGSSATIDDTFDIVIANTNDAPTLANAIADKNATEDSAFSFTFLTNTFNDVDVSDTLTYTATLSDGNPLPTWLVFDATTRTFSGTPLNADVGTISIKLTATDGSSAAIDDTFDIVIANTNDAPTLANAITDKNATEDSGFTFTFPTNTFNDVDVGDSLTYTATLSGGGALPTWLSFNAATRTFSGTPLNADVGTITIKLTATDASGALVDNNFAIVIANTNDAPTLANIIPNQLATEDSAFSFTIANNAFNDVDVGDSLSYNAQLSGGGALPTWLSFNAATRTFSGTPDNADVGTLSIEVTANDGNGGSIASVFDLVIANSNDAPTVANIIPNQVATEDSAFSFVVPTNTFTDMDIGDTLAYSAQLHGGGALPAWLSFDSATRTFSGTPLNGDVGTTTVIVAANDGNGGSVTTSFDITITNTNDAPTVANTIANQTATEDLVFNYQVPANTFVDVDTGTTLSYSATLANGSSVPAWLDFDATTRTFTGTPDNDAVGAISIQLTADDGQGGTATTSFTLTVLNSNDAPTVAHIIPEQITPEDTAFNFQFASNTFSDIDVGDSLTYTAQLSNGASLPAWLKFDPTTRTFSGTPQNANVGIIAIQVTASDGHGGTVATSFDLVVTNTPDAPTVVNPIQDKIVTIGKPFNFVIPSDTFNDPDAGDPLQYNVHALNGGSLPTWLTFNAVTNTLSGTPSKDFAGTSVAIEITVTDSDGNTISNTFTIAVDKEANTATTDRPNNIIEKPAEPEAVIETPITAVEPAPPSGDINIVAMESDEVPTRIATDFSEQPLLLTLNDISDPNDKNVLRAIEMRAVLEASNSSPLLASLISPDAGFSPNDTLDFNNALRRVHDEMNEAMDAEDMQKNIISGITFSVTTGLIIWSLRASSLLLTLMSMVPLWSGMDPLPILDQVNKRKAELEQQRKDKQKEDQTAKEVGYLFDQTQAQQDRNTPK